MATDQGKTSNLNALATVAGLTGTLNADQAVSAQATAAAGAATIGADGTGPVPTPSPSSNGGPA